VSTLGTVLLTGAAGAIGSHLRAPLRAAARELRISDARPLEAQAGNEVVVPADLADEAAVLAAADGADAVVHLGGIPSEGSFGELLGPNFVGTRNVFEAARRGGARRVVYASSNHATGMYASGHPLRGTEPVRPDSLYGVSKAFGEALGRMYADKFGLEVVCLRIGTFAERPQVARELSTWLSPADMTRLALAALTAGDVEFTVVYGVSANRRSWWDPEPGHAIGYQPQDDAEAFAAELDGDPGPLQGGEFTDPDVHPWST
jgi:uronate dehydrogenase